MERLRPLMAALLLTAAILLPAVPAAGAAPLPCDIYGSAGTPCVAAHSTVRALYASYSGPLYQVQRSSDGATADIGTLSAGGYANATMQNSFCAGTTCAISVIYDQSGLGNELTPAPAGGNGLADYPAIASALPVTVAGQSAYGVHIIPGMGYRNDSTRGVATGAQPQEAYMVTSAWHVNSGCCFDYGNAETNNEDDGNGSMDAVYFGRLCWFGRVVPGHCYGSSPWVMADMENGLFAGADGSNAANLGIRSTFVTALVKNDGTTTYAIKGGNSNSGGLTTFYEGGLPTQGGYIPMRQQGAIILGVGGDNSNGSAGDFFEGAITAGYPSDDTDNAVQAEINTVGYAIGGSHVGAVGPIVAGDDSTACVDNKNANATKGNPIQIWQCTGSPAARNWTVNANRTLTIDGGCMEIKGVTHKNGARVEWWPCNGGANQRWRAVNGQLVNPASGLCLDDTAHRTRNGVQLQVWKCNGGTNQQWRLP